LSATREPFRLVCFAAASLYLELAIIRFTAAEVLYLGFFSNFILISAFVGLGLGFLSARRGLELGRFVPYCLLFVFALCLVSKFDANVLRDKFGLFFFGNVAGRAGLPGSLLLFILFVATAGLFAGLGDLIGGLFPRFSALHAYTLDIAGSLIGILLFSVQSTASSGPVAWVVTGCLLVALGHLLGQEDGGPGRAGAVMVGGASAIVLVLSSAPGHVTLWSPYQKLDYLNGRNEQGQWRNIYANGILHQILHPADTADAMYYGVPYRLREAAGRPVEDVLIIGAGSGTDVAVALRHGVQSIDAVEIDPGIIELGQAFHPQRPFADPRTTVHATDGRAFLRNVEKKYDMVIFALTDSLIRLSSMTNIRLESYLFTLEALESAKARLKADGLLVLYNEYRWPWLTDKIAAMLQQTFGHPPLQITDGPTTVFVIGTTLHGKEQPRQKFARLAVDDWPFLYMRDPGIHWLYLGMMATFLLAALMGVLVLAPAGTLRRPDWPFFFMGAAFLLLETKSISLFSLLFGTTWKVNSYAFGGILACVLLANLVVQRFQVRRGALFALLFGAVAVAWLVPSHTLLAVEPDPLRYAAAVVHVFSPVFFANLVFSREFRDVDESTRAFGWNLLGAVAGGALEYLSLLLGQRSLLFVVAACYLLVAILLRGRRS